MPSLIESLVAGGLVRSDNKRLGVARRPMPKRLREVLEVFGAMGNTASFQGMGRSMDVRDATPQTLASAVLGRWLSNDEIADQAENYTGIRHLKRLLVSQEFRGSFARRIFDAFPEKQRLLHVRIPSCAGQHVTALMQYACCLIPSDVGSDSYDTPDTLAPLLGRLFKQINNVRGIALSSPRLAPFIDPPVTCVEGPDPLAMYLPQPPCRAVDLLFAIIRPPEALALSQVNGILTLLRDQPDSPAAQAIAAKRGQPPAPGRSAHWQLLARELLQELPRNPICHALGDGTADSAFAACARVPIELVGLDTYIEWARPSIDPKPIEPIGVSEPFLTAGALTFPERDIIADCMGEDIAFYAAYTKRRAVTGLPMVRGLELQQA
jgi:hypothetical protein